MAAYPPPVTYVLTVNSTNPSSGVAITVSPSDVNNAANGTTSFTRTYDSGATVTLTAPATAQVFLYSNASLAAIVAQSPLTVTQPSGGGMASTISTTFPAQSIAQLVVPQ